jgi:N-acetylmuramoyl-L-alanine amidase
MTLLKPGYPWMRRTLGILPWMGVLTLLHPPAQATPNPSPRVSVKPPRVAALLTPPKPTRIPLRPPDPAVRPRLYHIVWGDTLWGLARRFGVPLSALEQANHLTNDSVIYAGDYLAIPGHYVVQAGDTLRSIAAKVGVPQVLLWHANRMVTDRLEPGQTLVIPYLRNLPRQPYAAPPAPSGDTTERTPLPSRGTSNVSSVYSVGDVLLLAHLIQAEAGNQPFVGMVAVGAVVLNRLHHPGFPKSIPGVIQEPGQFESVANGTFRMAPGPLALMAAKAALEGWDPTRGALYFYNPALAHNTWMDSLRVTSRIAQQVFCR